MYTLRFSNSALVRSFPQYERSHKTCDSVALEIFRVRDEIEGSAECYQPIVEDSQGRHVEVIPTASRRRESRPTYGAESQYGTRSVGGRVIIEITEIDGRYVSGRYAGPG